MPAKAYCALRSWSGIVVSVAVTRIVRYKDETIRAKFRFTLNEHLLCGTGQALGLLAPLARCSRNVDSS